MSSTTKTQTLTSMFSTAQVLAEYTTLDIEVNEDYGFWITFNSVVDALAQVEIAKQKDWTRYIKQGGNPRNKRGHGAQFAAIKKAIVKAAA